MIRIVRSELVRIWRPSFRYGGIGAMAGFGGMISIFIFTSANDTAQTTQTAQAGPGGGFASAAQISQPGGFLTALGTTSQISGLVLLPLWAIAAASDYDTGLIRVLVQAQPNRLKLLTGKMIALTGFTVLATAITTLVIVLVARPLARLEGIDTEPWKTDFLPRRNPRRTRRRRHSRPRLGGPPRPHPRLRNSRSHRRTPNIPKPRHHQLTGPSGTAWSDRRRSHQRTSNTATTAWAASRAPSGAP